MSTTTSTTSKTQDHAADAAAFKSAVLTYVVEAERNEDGILAMANAYSNVHISKRANLQSEIMLEAFSAEGVVSERLPEVLATIQNVGSIATKTRAKVEVDPRVVAAERILVLRIAQVLVDKGNEDGDAEFVQGLVDLAIEEGRSVDYIGKAEAVLASLQRATSTTERATIKGSIKELVANGKLKVGDKLVGKYGNFSAVVEAEGLKVKGKVYGSPSAAADAAGVTAKATNGWTFWCMTVDGRKVAIGTLR